MFDLIENCLEIVPGTLADYKKLAEYHYVYESINPATQILKVRGTAETGDAFPDPIGIIVFRMPIINIGPRSKVLKQYFATSETAAEKLKFVNKNIRYLARLIVLPQFRRMGIGTWLVTEALKRQQVPIVETLTPIDWVCKIWQTAGFKLYLTPPPKRYRQLKTVLLQTGLTEQSLAFPQTVQLRLQNIHGKQKERIEQAIKTFIHSSRRHQTMKPGLERTKFVLSKLYYPECYWIWLNPRKPLNPAKPGENKVYRSGHPEKQLLRQDR